MSSHLMKMFHCWPAFPTYTVSLGCISGQHRLVSPPSFGSSAPLPLPLRTHAVPSFAHLHWPSISRQVIES